MSDYDRQARDCARRYVQEAKLPFDLSRKLLIEMNDALLAEKIYYVSPYKIEEDDGQTGASGQEERPV